MRTVADVERFLKDSEVPFQDLGGGMFIVTDDDSGLHNLAIKVEDAVVLFSLRVLDPNKWAAGERGRLFEQLLRLNGSGLLHAAFALQEDGVYLQAALPLPNLDSNELQAVLDDIGLATKQHLPSLRGDSLRPTH
ncbi:MAG: CesT family type III secretion system chaperone [Myxococcales bacterium]|nr:CesT family type III secretion system chaperone [Myxococcales bacterium]